MTFFNQKEDVLDIELTQFGKELLSRGEFKPSHYLFFDDDILYDIAAGGRLSEDQNTATNRIQNETPKLKTQGNYKELTEKLSTGIPQNTRENNFSVINALGTSDLSSDKFPRWDISMYGQDGPTIINSVAYMTSSYGTIRIPQNDIATNFKTVVSVEGQPSVINEDPSLSSTVQEDGTYISVEPKIVLMQLLEDYTTYDKENFDIEVFIKEEETATSAGVEVPVWTPLKFKKEFEPVVDGILVDPVPEECVELDPTFVEYYFDIFVDSEIAAESRAQMEDLNAQSLYNSQDSSVGTTTSMGMADIYSQVVVDPACPPDDCPES
tara:strand:+ start:950 stop:1921 length:972 start_codon:yes stop_codon:yes gene_type:complete